MTIEERVISTYQNNLSYLKINHIELYNQINALSEAINLNLITETYILEFKDDTYFDILQVQSNSYVYSTNSNDITEKIASSIDTSTLSSTFNTIHNDPKKLDDLYLYTQEIFDYLEKFQDKNSIHSTIPKFFFLRTLLGMHIPKIINNLSIQECFIYEPSLEVFRLSLFTTDYYSLAQQTNFTFAINTDTDTFNQKFTEFFLNKYSFNYSIKYHSLENTLLENIQKLIMASQPNSHKFTKRLNIFKQTLNNISLNYNLLNIEKLKNTLANKKVLLLASGPSLETNIQWLKENQNNFIIITVGANLNTLMQNDIKPDIVSEIHSELDILDNYKDIPTEYLNEIVFIGSVQVPSQLLNKFHKNNIFLFQSDYPMIENKNQITGLSVGNIILHFSYKFGAKDLYLLGLDFALSKDGDTHISSHAHKNMINKIDNQYFEINGNFQETVTSNSLFIHFLEEVNYFISQTKHLKLYNLSDGAFISNSIPLHSKDIRLSKNYNKSNFKKTIINKLNQSSTTGFIEQDQTRLKLSLTNLNLIIENIEKSNFTRKNIYQIINNNNISYIYRDIIINYMQNITHYIDNFLNNKKFKDQEQAKHKDKLDSLLIFYFKTITINYRDILINSTI